MENLFKSCITTTDQGNIGLCKALYEYQKMGYTISLPISENQKYDLILDDGQLKKVQVKTTQYKSKYGTYNVNIKTCGGNKSNHKIHYFDCKNCDILFILTDSGDVYSIPSDEVKSKSTLTLSKKFDKFKI